MENNQKSGIETGLGIASLVLGCVALFISFIPCFGAFAIYFAPVAALLGGYALYIAKQNNQSTGLPLGGLIVSLLAFFIAAFQAHQISSASNSLYNMNNDLRNGRDPFSTNHSSGNSPYLILMLIVAAGVALFFYRTYKTKDSNAVATPNNEPANPYQPPVTSPVVESKGALFCHNCGTANEPGDLFCKNCGTKLK